MSHQLTLGPQNAYRGPPKKFDVMLHLETERTLKHNILVADTILTESGP